MLIGFLTVWIPAVLIALGVLAKRRATLMRTASTQAAVAYVALVATETLAFANQMLGALLLVTPRDGLGGAGPWPWAAVNVVMTTVVALDALLFLFSGMRLQVSLLSFADALHEFADGLPWRRALAATGATLVLLLGASAFAFRAGAVAGDAPVGAALLALGLALTAATAGIRNKLPMVLTYEWNNRVLAWEGTQARRAMRRVLSRSSAELVDERGVPLVFTSASEKANPMGPDYPLLRANLGFTGKEHFKLDLQKDEKPHVVILFLESFRGADVGALGATHRQSVTPNFDALSREGVLWTNFYANGTITSRAMASAFFGVLPDFREYSNQVSANPPPVTGLPHIMTERGYLSAFFSDGPLEWENKREFMLNHGFPLFYGAPSIKSAYPQAPNSVWNFSDEYLMRFHADWLERQDQKGQPTFSALLTVTTHFPFEVPDDAPVPDVDMDKNTPYYRYLRTILYTDWCVGLYMDLLRQKGLDKKTVFLIMGDHGQQVDAQGQVMWSGHYTSEGVRVPLLLLAPGRVQPKVIKETASQVDILPTVLDMLGIRAVHHAVGSSLVRESDNRQAISVHPWSPGMLANAFGNFRYVYNFDAQKSALYDMSRDPKETRDISALHPDLVKTQEQQVWLLRAYLNSVYSERRLTPDVGKPYLRFPRLHEAPEAFPRTLQQCEQRARLLMAQFAKGSMNESDLAELGIAVVVSAARGMTDAERLELAQLLFLRANLGRMGEMTNQETRRLAELEEKLESDLENPDAPAWMQQIALGVRKLARNPRYPELRSIPQV